MEKNITKCHLVNMEIVYKFGWIRCKILVVIAWWCFFRTENTYYSCFLNWCRTQTFRQYENALLGYHLKGKWAQLQWQTSWTSTPIVKNYIFRIIFSLLTFTKGSLNEIIALFCIDNLTLLHTIIYTYLLIECNLNRLAILVTLIKNRQF